MESARSAALLVTSINTYRMGHRVSIGNQQIVNWDSGRIVAFSRVHAERGLDLDFTEAANRDAPDPEPSRAGLFGGHHVRKWLPAKHRRPHARGAMS